MEPHGVTRPADSDAPESVMKRRKIDYASGEDSYDLFATNPLSSTTQPTQPLPLPQDTQATLPLPSVGGAPPVWTPSNIQPLSSPPASYAATQPTQPLPGVGARNSPPRPAAIQVPASSPFQLQPSAARPSFQANPAPIVKPFDFYPSKARLDSDGPQYVGSSSEGEGSDNDIKPTFGPTAARKPVPSISAMRERQASSPAPSKVDRVAESPIQQMKQHASQFAYTGGRLDSLTNPPPSQKTVKLDLSRLNCPPQYMGLIKRLKDIAPEKTDMDIIKILVAKKGNFDDAAEALTSDTPVELTKEDLAAQAMKMKTLNRGNNAGKIAIKDKYGAVRSKAISLSPSPPPEPRALKRRLVRGSDKNSSNSTPAPTPPPTRQPKQIVIDSDSDSAAELDGENSEDERELERKVLKYLNSCTVKELMDIACTTEEIATLIVEQRPYRTLGGVRNVQAPAATHTKSGKKTKGARPRAVGEKIVDVCLDTWRGYEAVDSLIRRVEELGKPVAEAVKKWGVDVVSGAGASGELDMTEIKIDDSASAKDSGIGTPTDSGDPQPEDADGEINGTKRVKNVGFFKDQPKELREGVILKDYQITGINWLNLLYEKKLSCILADEMGLGKTCQVISFLTHLYSKGITGPHLIVVPSSTLENWLREFANFSPTLKVEPYYGSQKDRQMIRSTLLKDKSWNVLVTTYQIATGDKLDRGFLKNLDFNVCVYDEGHMLKNSQSSRYDNLIKLPAKFRLLLTGTPLQNNLQELASLLAFILPSVFEEKKDALQSIFKYKAKTQNEDESNSALLSQQRIKRARAMMTPFVLRRKKLQVLKHLPQKTQRVEYCELHPRQAEIYQEKLENDKEAIAARAEGKKTKTKSNVMMELRKAAIHPLLFRTLYPDDLCRKMTKDIVKEDYYKDNDPEYIYEDMLVMNDFELNRLCDMWPKTIGKYRLKHEEWMDSGKIDALKRLLKEMREAGDRVLIFSQFTQTLDILELVLTTLDMEFLRIDGQTAVDARQDLIDQYHEQTDIMVFLLSTKAGGFGINLACANKVIILDSSFNPHDDAQASDRAHRVGQTREVEVIRLITKGTIEENILQLANTKLALDQSISEGDDAAIELKGEELVAKMLLNQTTGKTEATETIDVE